MDPPGPSLEKQYGVLKLGSPAPNPAISIPRVLNSFSSVAIAGVGDGFIGALFLMTL